MKALGQRIRELRTKKGLGVQELAQGIKKTAGYVSRIETRGEIPSAELLLLIADVLDGSADELLALAKESQLARVAEQIDARQHEALSLFRKRKK